MGLLGKPQYLSHLMCQIQTQNLETKLISQSQKALVQEYNLDQQLESHQIVRVKTKFKENKLVCAKTSFGHLNVVILYNGFSLGGVARKLTRSSSARIRKSKHVLGKKVSDSDSEPEATISNKSSGTTGKRKPATAKGKSSSIGNRKAQLKDISSYSGSAPSSQESCTTPTVEERKCPMAGCDSSGMISFYSSIILNHN